MYRIVSILFLVASSHAGVLDKGLLSAFTSGTKKMDVVFQFPNVMGGVLSSGVLNGLSGDDKTSKMVSTLKDQTSAMQAPIISSLGLFGINEDQVTSFWANNMFSVKDAELGPLQAAAALPGAFTIRAPYKVNALPIDEASRVETRAANVTLQWGVAKIHSDTVWAAGFEGQGVVVGVIDTGLNAQHVALVNRYRGGPYSWKDAVGGKDTPYDGHGHGTHCAGTIAGDQNGIGVARKAQVIACKGLDDKGSGSDITLTACGQFMICPSGEENGCVGRPNIVSNSWGGQPPGDNGWYDPVITAMRAANIIPVFAIGNSGPFCNTAGSPGDRAKLVSVGATGPDDTIAYFSSRGTSLKKKPETSAPGVDIVSADAKNNGEYVKMSGTSMACPHFAGAAALVLSAHPDYSYDQVVNALVNSGNSVKPKGSLWDIFCPGYPAGGAGRIDVAKALNLTATAS